MEKKGLEISVGLFLLIGLLCLAYLALSLGNVGILKSNYIVYARFSNVAGLKVDGSVTMAGVDIGHIQDIRLQDDEALVTLSIDNAVRLQDDVIASIKTTGIIGDKYISITPGASEEYIEPGGYINDTQPAFDLEDAIGKFVFGSVGEGKQQ